MFQGNWKCSKCGGSITELPFQPRSEAGLTCRACFIKEKNGETAPEAELATAGSSDDRQEVPPFDPLEGSVASEPAPESPDIATAPAATGERKMFQGDWQCSICGNAITSLPFEPRNTTNLKCIDCFKKGS